MKKYIKPEFKTVLLNNQTILAGSGNVDIDTTPMSGDDVGAKGNAIWKSLDED